MHILLLKLIQFACNVSCAKLPYGKKKKIFVKNFPYINGWRHVRHFDEKMGFYVQAARPYAHIHSCTYKARFTFTLCLVCSRVLIFQQAALRHIWSSRYSRCTGSYNVNPWNYLFSVNETLYIVAICTCW